MNSRVLAVGAVASVLVVGTIFFLTRSEPEPVAEPVARNEAPAPKPAASTPAATPAPRTDRPRTAKPAEAAPAAEPAAPEPVAEAAPETGVLRITADIPGAQVFIDRAFVGVAPATAEGIKPGTHTLNVAAEGYDGIVQSIDVEPGPRDIAVRFKEVRLDAKLDVVHKHRIGQCVGRLVATPRGMRYETANKDDAFNVGMFDLDQFQVEYLDKTLRIRTKNGKQYNFTDPAGNADRLFVFHRDVEKARERLKKGDPPAAD